MRKEILEILRTTNKIMENRREKEKTILLNKIRENTEMIEENIYRVFSSKYLDGEEKLNVTLELYDFDILEDFKYKNNLIELNNNNILLFKLGNEFIPFYYKELLDSFLDEGFAINYAFYNNGKCNIFKYSINIRSEYYHSFIIRSLELK